MDMNTAVQEYVDELKRRMQQQGYVYKEEDLKKLEERTADAGAAYKSAGAGTSPSSPAVEPAGLSRPMSPLPATATSASPLPSSGGASSSAADEDRRTSTVARQKSSNTFNFTFNVVGDAVASVNSKVLYQLCFD